MNAADIRERLLTEGLTLVVSTPDEFAAFLQREIAKNARIIKAAGITASS